MKRVKKRIFSGCVLEQIIYNVAENATPRTAKPRLRFRSEEERAHHRETIAKRRHARTINASFSPRSLFVTLTFDDAHYKDDMEHCKKIRANYLRRLRRIYPDAIISAYIGRGRHTRRIHLHLITDGIPARVLTEKWREGCIVRIENLREHNVYDGIDHGRDYTGLANYLYGHWTPEVGGHRYIITRNAEREDHEDARECKRDYSETHPPQAPEGYMLVEAASTPYGYQYFKYILKPTAGKAAAPPGKNRGMCS